MVVAAFVAPFLLEATARFVVSAAKLPGVRLGVVTATPADQLPAGLKELLAGHWRVDDALDPQHVLARGYAWLTDADGRVLHSVQQLSAGQALQATLADGRAGLSVTGIEPAP